MINVAVVGGTGYTGIELLRILLQHPQVNIRHITSRAENGKKVTQTFPSLNGLTDLAFSLPDIEKLSTCDVVFFATPHGVAMEQTPEIIKKGCKVIDLSADFRLKDTDTFQNWYNMVHTCPDVLANSVYGLPEFNREEIKSASVVANPGCYPTASQLAVKPLLEAGLIDHSSIIIDAKSGISGAGREAKVSSLYAEVSESFTAYGMDGHRHWPEITQTLNDISSSPVSIVFIPHLVPMNRGIEATIYAKLIDDVSESTLMGILHSAYKDEPFVDVVNTIPNTRSVRGSNLCRISLRRPRKISTVVITAVIDNLVKGASGQAVQNMNIMFGLEETCGLQHIPLSP